MSIKQEHGASTSVRSPVAMVSATESHPTSPADSTVMSPIREFLNSRGSGRLADQSFAAVMLLCACSIFLIVLFIFTILIVRSHLSLTAFGWKFFTGQAWDPVAG